MKPTVAFCLALALAGPAAAASPSTRVVGGLVTGVRTGPAVVFRSIPYAAPPVGPLRWKPPQPVRPWSGPLDASRPGPACMQAVPQAGTNLGGYAGPVSEDCLTLDVTAPAKRMSGKGAPVFVWIPGGGNIAGGANVPSYDAVNFARDGVIVVTPNYRLGALGFFAHPALTREAGPGEPLVDYGLMDQIAVLKWVRRNIRAFGGDPERVTLGGESAGGGDTLALMATPAARGLFRQAIVESGGGWNKPASLAEREAQGAELASRLGLAGAAATPEQLRALPAEKLTVAAGGVAEDGRLITESPTQAFARGDAAAVPILIGSNSNEASLMAPGDKPPAPPLVQAAYADAPSDAERRRLMFNDFVMGAPARWIAARQSARAPAFLYYFSYVPERQRQNAEGTNKYARPGTNHASEIPFVFDSLDAVPGRTPLITPSERAAAALAHSCWVGFIRTGAPQCAGGVAWPAYRPDTDQLLEIGMDTGVRTHFRKPQLDAQEAAVMGR
jgi:para-nitrobenzyl esterase